MARYDVVVIGASAGGVAFLQRLVERLPRGFGAAVFVALHLPEGARSALPAILERAGPLPASPAQDGARFHPGHIYVAPPGFHLTLERTHMRVSRGPRDHGMRPAIDPLFRTAALAAGPRVIGVVLSGLLDDGTVGLREIKKAGGLTIVQDPAEAPFSGMPESALAHVNVDYCLPVADIGQLLDTLAACTDATETDPARVVDVRRRRRCR
jgi:two-component system, chemotaxis family, protein-glutamate methylesterase/glutaminase